MARLPDNRDNLTMLCFALINFALPTWLLQQQAACISSVGSAEDLSTVVMFFVKVHVRWKASLLVPMSKIMHAEDTAAPRITGR